MALDFPASPTNGQVFGNFYYDSSITAWRNLGSKNALSTSITNVDNRIGLVPIIPTSVAVGSGSATVSSKGTISFTSATSISLNGCFTSAYADYKILFKQAATTVDADLNVRLRAGGSDYASATAYSNQGPLFTSTSMSAYNNISTNKWLIGAMPTASVATTMLDMTLGNPNLASWTLLTSTASGYAGGAIKSFWQNGYYAASDVFDGITLYPGAGNFTGTVQVYGLRN